MQLLHTPLHVSCGHNKVEVIKFLLEWQGPEKVKVDAVNMVGKIYSVSGCHEAI